MADSDPSSREDREVDAYRDADGRPLAMRLYHYTTRDRAAQIIAEGFRASPGDSLFPAGVWLSDSSAERHRAMGRHRDGQVVVVDVPDDVAHRFQVADFPGRWREFCIPAEIVNCLPPTDRTLLVRKGAL